MIYMAKVPSVPHLIHSITINNIRSQRKPKRTLLKKKTSQNLCYLIMVSKQKISEKMSQLRQELFTLQHPTIDRTGTATFCIYSDQDSCVKAVADDLFCCIMLDKMLRSAPKSKEKTSKIPTILIIIIISTVQR